MKANKKKTFILIVVAFLLFFVINLVAGNILAGLRIDLTENNIFTLSPGTKNIVSKLNEKIKFKVFYSRDEMNAVPYLKSFSTRVIGLLKQYESLSNGKIDIEFIDPEPFSEEEDQAVKLGIQPVPLNDSGDKLYFGMVITSGKEEEKTKVIPFFNPEKESSLEYEITRMIYELSNPEKPVIGLLNWLPTERVSLPIFLRGDEDWVVFSRIKEDFNVKVLNKDIDKIPDDVKVLFIVHPINPSENLLYAIDQFILSGGHALIMLDPYLELNSIDSKNSNLSKLLKAWGVDFVSDKVVLDPENALRVNYRDENFGIRSVTKLNWLALGKEFMNTSDVVTSELGQIRVASTGHFKILKDLKEKKDSLSWDPLIFTSKMSTLIDPSLTHSPFSILENYVSSEKSSKTSFTIAGRLSGTVETAFPQKKGEKHLQKSTNPTNIILIGDVDMLRDIFWVTKQNFLNRRLLIQTADNASLIANALDNLSGSNDLISIRSKNVAERPFEVVRRLRLEAEKKYLKEEKELLQKLRETEEKIAKLERAKDGEKSVVITKEQQKELEKFKEELINTRKRLREVKHNLQKDIEQLGSIIKFFNVILPPLIVIILGFLIPKYLGIKRS